MENYIVKGSKGDFFIPDVKLEFETGRCEISGESYLENAVTFYTPITEWVTKFFVEYPNKTLHFIFQLTYFNTSSSKRIIELLAVLRGFLEEGRSVVAEWRIEENDSDVYDEVEDFSLVSKMPIKIVEVPYNSLRSA